MGGSGVVPPEGGDGEVPGPNLGPNPGPNPGPDPTPDSEKPEIGTTKEVPAQCQFVYEKDKSGKYHYALRFTPLAVKGINYSVDAVSGATEGGGMLPVPDQPEAGEKEVPASWQFTYIADGTAKGHYEIQFDLPKAVREDAGIDAVSSATNEGGGDGDGDLGGGDGDEDLPIIPSDPEISPEFQQLYQYVKTLKTHFGEVKDSFITVNGVEATESVTLTLGETNSFLVQESKLTPSGNKVALSADLFDNKKQVKVVIHVKGYKDLEMVVDGRAYFNK